MLKTKWPNFKNVQESIIFLWKFYCTGVHYEDQLASEKKCGHLGGKVLIPTLAHERNLNAGRLGADVCGVPIVLVARTDAESAQLITSDVDDRDRMFIDYKAGRTSEGFFRLKANTGLQHCIQRGLAYAKCSDLLWWVDELFSSLIYNQVVLVKHQSDGFKSIDWLVGVMIELRSSFSIQKKK